MFFIFDYVMKFYITLLSNKIGILRLFALFIGEISFYTPPIYTAMHREGVPQNTPPPLIAALIDISPGGRFLGGFIDIHSIEEGPSMYVVCSFLLSDKQPAQYAFGPFLML